MIHANQAPRRGRRQKIQAVAVAAGLALACANVRAQTSVSWNSAVSGSWETASNWSDGLVPDNSNPPGSDYAVLIGAQGPAYTVTTYSGHTIDSLTLDSSSATLNLGASLNSPFAIGTLTVGAGNLNLYGASLSHTTLVSTLPDYQLGTGNAYLDSASLGSNVAFAGEFDLKNNLQLNGHTLFLSGSSTLDNGVGVASAYSDVTVQNGTIQLIGNSLLTTEPSTSYNLTINSDATVNLGTQGWITSGGPNFVNNLGSIVASTTSPLNVKLMGVHNSGLIDLEGSGTLNQSTVNITNLTNTGTVKLSNQTVTFTSPGANTGTISIDNSLVFLNNTSLNFLQSIKQPGAYIVLQGNFDLSDQTFDPAAYGGYLGSLSNGTIKSSAPITYNIPLIGRQSNAYLKNVTVASPLIYGPASYSAILELENVTLADSSITAKGATYVTIDPSGSPGNALDGTGTVNFSDNLDVGENATVGPDVTLMSTGGGTVRILPYSTFLGTLRAGSGGILGVQLDGSFQGTFQADAGGAIVFETGWTELPTNARVGSGIFAFGGNAGNATLDFTNAPGGPIDLGGAMISNSAIVSPGRTIRVVEGPQLSNVIVAANLSLQNTSGLQIQNGLTLSNSTISLDGASADLQFTGAQTLGGNGQIIFNGPLGSISGGTATAPVTIGSGISISTGRGSGTISGQIINYGTLSASGTGQTLAITSLTNHGTVSASNGGILSLTSPWTTDSPITVDHAAVVVSGNSIAADLPTLAMNNATLVLEGPYDNTGATLHVNDSTRLLAVGPGAQLTGGTIDSPTGDALQVWPSTANGTSFQSVVLNTPVSGQGTSLNLTSVTIGGPMSLDNSQVTLSGTWSSNGSLSVSNNSILRLSGTPAQVGSISAKDSVVEINVPLSSATLNGFDISNSTVMLSSTIDNTNGTLVVNANGNQTYIGSPTAGPAKIIGGTIVSGSTTPFTVNGTLDGVTLAASATQGFGAPGGLSIVDGLTLSNATLSITYEGDAQEIYGDMAQGTQTIAGNGQIVFDYAPQYGPGSPNRYPFFGVSSGATLTIGSGVTFETGHSGGYLGNQGGAIVSNGTILSLPRLAQGTDTTIFLDGTITNNGVFHAAGGTISLKSTANLTNLANGVLTGGTYLVDDQSTMDFGMTTISENAADVELSGPNSHFDALAALAVNSGKFVVAGGRVFSTAGDLSNSGSLTIGDRSSLILPAGHLMTNTGVLGGTGILQGNVVSHGVIAPGGSSGTLTIQGDLRTGADSNLEFAIGGAGANVHCDTLDVTGNLQLAGTLELSFDSDFVPNPMTIDLIQAGSFTGSFDSSELPALPDGMTWDTSDLNIGQVSITPEPSSLALIGLLGAGILTLRRRRKLGRSSAAMCCQ